MLILAAKGVWNIVLVLEEYATLYVLVDNCFSRRLFVLAIPQISAARVGGACGSQVEICSVFEL